VYGIMYGELTEKEPVPVVETLELPERAKYMIGLAVSSATSINGGVGWSAIGMLDVLFQPQSASATAWWTVDKINLPSMGDLVAAHIALWSRADDADGSSDSGSRISSGSQAQVKSRFGSNLMTSRSCTWLLTLLE
jgi:hypothetical protein